ncbi:hypothetical protein ORIO_06415 [Cereibacter azotoformans]|uniref:phage major capsid protein n=1 Tax=Cereibacter azotoformans TaxID=43057 RepID=UPI001EEC5357|nr:hypothetical protein [Cereibacter azotoformans]ULB09557.1 hypothetical protein ORIO_06415 [Cereibacter azotoformans]
MNVRLTPDNSNTPTARRLAQVRLAAGKAGLPDQVADLMAESGLAVSMFDAAATGLSRAMEAAQPFIMSGRLTMDVIRPMLRAALASATGGDAEALAAAVQRSACDAMVAKMAADEPPGRSFNPAADVGQSWESPRGLAQKIADGQAAIISARLGLRHEPTMGREFAGENSRLMAARAWATANGIHARTDAEAREAYITGRGARFAMANGVSDWPVHTGATLEIVLARAVEQAPIPLAGTAHTITASDFRARTLAGTTGASKLKKVLENGEPASVIIDETGEAVSAPVRYAGMFRATDELIRNAETGGLELEVMASRVLIEAAQSVQRDVLVAAITGNANLADGNPVFHSSRGNTAETGAAINVTSLAVSRTGMARFVDGQGVARPVVPAILAVPPEYQLPAEQLVAEIAAAQVEDVNPFARKLRIVADPGLPATGTHYWYVLPDPAGTDGLAMIVLDDMVTPRVESRDAWPNFGMEWRVQWPLAASFVRPSWFRTKAG